MSGGSSFMVTMPWTRNMSSCFSPVSMVCSMRQQVGWVVLVTSNWPMYSCCHSDTPFNLWFTTYRQNGRYLHFWLGFDTLLCDGLQSVALIQCEYLDWCAYVATYWLRRNHSARP
jgi:hypothetical protein